MDIPAATIVAVRNTAGERQCSDVEIKSKRSERTSVAMLVQSRSLNKPIADEEVETQAAAAEVRFLMHRVCRDSSSTIPALEEENKLRLQEVESEDVSQCLEWFSVKFNNVGKNGRVTLKDFKRVAQECEGFGEHLFKLFDTDHSCTVSLQELIGGMGKLTIRSKKKKILKWFEEVFTQVSGDDHLLQMDEFKRALLINGFIERFYQLMDSDNSGRLTTQELLDAFGKLTCMDKDAKWLAWFEEQFSLVAGTDRKVDLQEFEKALDVKESFFATRFFQLFDKDKSGFISLKELMDGLTLLTNGSKTEKLKFLFQVYDVDGNGLIDFEELRTVLKSCMDESALRFSEDKLNELTRALFDDADTDGSGTITFEELQSELAKHPGVVENLTISAAMWLKPPSSQRRRVATNCIPQWLTWRYIRNNVKWIVWLSIYVVFNIILFVVAMVIYRSKGPAVMIARGCGQCLNFNPVLMIILMMRRGITWLRSTRLAPFLPLDQTIQLHKLAGYCIVLFSLMHTMAHLVNVTLLNELPPENVSKNSLPMWEFLFYWGTPFGWVGGVAGLTGVILLIILLVMFVFALPCVRTRGYFEVFYWTHNLFIFWYIVLILHGSNFWKWFLVPGILYILERILRSKWVKLARYGRTYIQEVSLLPSKVTHLVINRPANFNYEPGDYIFVQIPTIAKYEWHPFTVSSAPEQQGFLWLHVRSAGTWTNKLYKYFENRNKSKKLVTLQLQMPKEHNRFHLIAQEQAILGWGEGRSEAGSLEDIHPLAVTQTLTEQSRKQTDGGTSIRYGQDFSHLWIQPTIIDVQLEEAEGQKGLEVYIDGPYGTPSGHIFQAEHAVLIGAGIGVTPFASILQSIVMRYRNARQVCPRCNHGWTGDIPTTVMRLKKVDFFWINRDQTSFEWFVSLLSQLEIEQSEQQGFDRFLDMHMYMTSALKKTDVKAIGLQMALDLIHKKDKRDMITGLRTRTQAGRPDWDKVFQQLDNARRGKITVFFCGAPAIEKVLKATCDRYGFEFRKENF